MFPTKALLVVASCLLAVQAQSSTTSTAPAAQSSAAGLDTCILTCVSGAASAGNCSSYTDLACVCTSTAFQQAAQACLQANCTTADQAAAQALQSQECSALSSGSGTASTAPSTAVSTASSTGTSASGSASAKSSSAAMGLSTPFSFGGIVGTLIASAGVLVGAGFVL